jgi:hypothetical protein
MPTMANASFPFPRTSSAQDGSGQYHDDVSIYEMDDHMPRENVVGAGTGAERSGGGKGSEEEMQDIPAAMREMGIARHTLGLILLLVVVLLWTTSNFLGSVRTSIAARTASCDGVLC